MTTVTISLDTVEKVKGFVNTVAPLEGDIDLGSDRYVVDAKSIMGIFSLDLSKPLKVSIHSAATAERLLPLLEPYTV
jgi:phosphotransferase system HPr-like phosphotransfer protein